jgi:hypothetical protein
MTPVLADDFSAALAERPLRDQTWDLRRDERQWARCAASGHSRYCGQTRLLSYRHDAAMTQFNL